MSQQVWNFDVVAEVESAAAAVPARRVTTERGVSRGTLNRFTSRPLSAVTQR